MNDTGRSPLNPLSFLTVAINTKNLSVKFSKYCHLAGNVQVCVALKNKMLLLNEKKGFSWLSTNTFKDYQQALPYTVKKFLPARCH